MSTVVRKRRTATAGSLSSLLSNDANVSKRWKSRESADKSVRTAYSPRLPAKNILAAFHDHLRHVETSRCWYSLFVRLLRWTSSCRSSMRARYAMARSNSFKRPLRHDRAWSRRRVWWHPMPGCWRWWVGSRRQRKSRFLTWGRTNGDEWSKTRSTRFLIGFAFE